MADVLSDSHDQTRRSGRRAAAGWLGVLALCASTGCYRVTAPGPTRPTSATETRSMTTLVWGAFQDDDLDGACGGSGAIGEVRATTPFLYAVVTIATLGFWAPMRVEVRCLDAGASRASL